MNSKNYRSLITLAVAIFQATQVLFILSERTSFGNYYHRLTLAIIGLIYILGVELQKRKCWLSPNMETLNNRRGRFIVLGSSGECLPVKRSSGLSNLETQEDSLYSSCNSSDDEFHSANESFDYGNSIIF